MFNYQFINSIPSLTFYLVCQIFFPLLNKRRLPPRTQLTRLFALFIKKNIFFIRLNKNHCTDYVALSMVTKLIFFLVTLL